MDLSLEIDIEEAKKLLKIYYNLEGLICSLPGETDHNFKVETKTKSYIFKITTDFYNNNFFDFQYKLLIHLNGFNAPNQIKSVEGNPYVLLKDLTSISALALEAEYGEFGL